jgi:hypothetical protein
MRILALGRLLAVTLTWKMVPDLAKNFDRTLHSFYFFGRSGWGEVHKMEGIID